MRQKFVRIKNIHLKKISIVCTCDDKIAVCTSGRGRSDLCTEKKLNTQK